ncbi:MAG: N-acetyltransferase family protein [Acidobacteriota bacterium]
MKTLIRDMNASDWPAVERIYAEGIATGIATFETSTPAWHEFDATHLAQPRLVAMVDGALLGWGALSPVSHRAVYRGVAEVSVYVSNAARGRGIGGLLLESLIESSENHDLWTLQATIFAENETSLRLHQRFGFRVVGRRERIAQRLGTWHDTVLLERRSEKL